MSYDDRKSIVQAVIDYCNNLLVGVPSTQLSKLQRLQNVAARLVSNVAKYDHITSTLKLSIAGRSGILDVLGDYLTAMTGVFSYGGRRPSQNVYLV